MLGNWLGYCKFLSTQLRTKWWSTHQPGEHARFPRRRKKVVWSSSSMAYTVNYFQVYTAYAKPKEGDIQGQRESVILGYWPNKAEWCRARSKLILNQLLKPTSKTYGQKTHPVSKYSICLFYMDDLLFAISEEFFEDFFSHLNHIRSVSQDPVERGKNSLKKNQWHGIPISHFKRWCGTASRRGGSAIWMKV